MMELVKEDRYGAYRGVTAEFLEKARLIEDNPNFAVFDTLDGQNRFIAGKCSRLPDDDSRTPGVYGINFHRAKPALQDAIRYQAEFPASLWSQQNVHGMAFSAADESEYNQKSAVWESFYSYIWGKAPLTIWVTPHSGVAERKPDADFAFPKLEMDGFIAGIAARCFVNNRQPAVKRTMASLHCHNFHGAILDLGGFGVNQAADLARIAEEIETKYHRQVQDLADKCAKDNGKLLIGWLERIIKTRGTLDPQELAAQYLTDNITVRFIARGLELYGITIQRFTLNEFKEAFRLLQCKEIQVISCNHIFPGELIGKQLDMAGKITHNGIGAALQIECMKYYLKHAPELVSAMILEIISKLDAAGG
jgi:hypothetical protein